MKKLTVLLAGMLIATTALADHHGGVKATIEKLAHQFNDAYATNDADTYFGFYTEDSMLYFFGSRQDVAEYDESWRAAIAAGGGAQKNDMSDLQIQVLSDSVAVASYFVDNESKSPDGSVASAKAFETDVWQKIDGEWKIVSLHYTEIAPAE